MPETEVPSFEPQPFMEKPAFHKTQPETTSKDNKRLTFKTFKRLVARGVVPVTVLSASLISACSGLEGNANQTSTPEPYFPPGVDLATNTAMPSQTATVEVQPSKTPESTQTAEATETMPSFPIEIDPSLEGKTNRFNLTTDQIKAAIQKASAEFPVAGNLKIKVVPGDLNDSFEIQTESIQLGFDGLISTEETTFETGHELSHYYDDTYNGDYLSQFISPEQINMLKDLREKALSDPFWGRNYPSLEKIFSPVKNTVENFPKPNYTPEQLAAVTNNYPDAFWISGDRGHGLLDPFIAYMPSTDLMKPYLEEPHSVSPYNSLEDFLDKQNDRIVYLSAKDPVFAAVIAKLRQKIDLFTAQNVQWTVDTPVNAYLNGGWQSMRIWEDAVLLEAFENNDQSIINLFPADKLDQIKADIQTRKQISDNEKWANLLSLTATDNVETSATPYLKALKTSVIQNTN